MTIIRIMGNPFGTTGFANHITNLAIALNENETVDSVLIEPVGQLPQDWQSHCDPRVLDMIKNSFKTFEGEDVTIVIDSIQTCELVRSRRPKNMVFFLIWEGDKLPSYYYNILDDPVIKQIWVPSNHVKDTLKEHKQLLDKTYLIPHGVDFSVFNQKVKPLADVQNDAFTFLFVGGWAQGMNDRKGLQFLIQAFSEEFKREDPVELIIKINTVYNDPNWTVENEVTKLGLPEDRPSMPVILSSLTNDKLASLYKNADVFVCTTMCEGFGLIFGEALSCGIPVITTGYGGQTDFCTNINSWIIDKGEMIWAHERSGMYEEVRWFKPDIGEIRRVLREAFNNKDVLKEKQTQAASSVGHLSWTKTAEKAVAALQLKKLEDD